MIRPIALMRPPISEPSTWIDRVQECAIGAKVDRTLIARLDNLRADITQHICATQKVTDDMIDALYLLVLYQRKITDVMGGVR